MNKEQIYQAMKQENYLPGSMRWRVGSVNENESSTDTIRFTTPDGKAYVVEYRTFEEGKKTFSDVFEIYEINTSKQTING